MFDFIVDIGTIANNANLSQNEKDLFSKFSNALKFQSREDLPSSQAELTTLCGIFQKVEDTHQMTNYIHCMSYTVDGDLDFEEGNLP